MKGNTPPHVTRIIVKNMDNVSSKRNRRSTFDEKKMQQLFLNQWHFERDSRINLWLVEAMLFTFSFWIINNANCVFMLSRYYGIYLATSFYVWVCSWIYTSRVDMSDDFALQFEDSINTHESNMSDNDYDENDDGDIYNSFYDYFEIQLNTITTMLLRSIIPLIAIIYCYHCSYTASSLSNANNTNINTTNNTSKSGRTRSNSNDKRNNKDKNSKSQRNEKCKTSKSNISGGSGSGIISSSSSKKVTQKNVKIIKNGKIKSRTKHRQRRNSTSQSNSRTSSSNDITIITTDCKNAQKESIITTNNMNDNKYQSNENGNKTIEKNCHSYRHSTTKHEKKTKKQRLKQKLQQKILQSQASGIITSTSHSHSQSQSQSHGSSVLGVGSQRRKSVEYNINGGNGNGSGSGGKGKLKGKYKAEEENNCGGGAVEYKYETKYQKILQLCGNLRVAYMPGYVNLGERGLYTFNFDKLGNDMTAIIKVKYQFWMIILGVISLALISFDIERVNTYNMISSVDIFAIFVILLYYSLFIILFREFSIFKKLCQKLQYLLYFDLIFLFLNVIFWYMCFSDAIHRSSDSNNYYFVVYGILCFVYFQIRLCLWNLFNNIKIDNGGVHQNKYKLDSQNDFFHEISMLMFLKILEVAYFMTIMHDYVNSNRVRIAHNNGNNNTKDYNCYYIKMPARQFIKCPTYFILKCLTNYYALQMHVSMIRSFWFAGFALIRNPRMRIPKI